MVVNIVSLLGNGRLTYRAQATVEGVYEEYNKRSAYIAYLVKSQQKFQDAKLQVAAVQTAVDRYIQYSTVCIHLAVC